MVSYIKNRIIHRFIRDIADYEEGGVCYGQILPADTQVYAVYPEQESTSGYSNAKSGLYYVIGDGIHTYSEIRDGHGQSHYNIEYRAVPASALDAIIAIFSKVKITDLQDGDYLVYDAKQDAWVNKGGKPLPPDVIDGGGAWTVATDTIDGGDAYSQVFDIVIDGGDAGAAPVPSVVDGGDSPDAVQTNTIDGTSASQTTFDEIIDGGTVI